MPQGFWYGVSMERPYGAVNDEHLGIRYFTEEIYVCHMILAWCDFNEVHWIISDGENREIDDNFWNTGAFGVNVSEILDNLEGGVSGRTWSLALLILFG